jgi:predicted small lipoprotein YifL
MILKLRISSLALAFSALSLSISGCGEDNESTALKNRPNAVVPDAAKNTPPPKTRNEAFDRQNQQGGTQGKASGYPGAK